MGKSTTASPSSFNNDLGIPLTILDAVGSRNLVVEVGANTCGEIEPLARLVAPNIAIITSIQKAHLKGFGSIDTILNEKINDNFGPGKRDGSHPELKKIYWKVSVNFV